MDVDQFIGNEEEIVEKKEGIENNNLESDCIDLGEVLPPKKEEEFDFQLLPFVIQMLQNTATSNNQGVVQAVTKFHYNFI